MSRVLAVCAGYGGLELGLELAGAQPSPVCYVEREAYSAAVLAARMADGLLGDAPIWSDLAAFDGSPWRGLVDLVTGGIPCQPFSVAGQRRGTADERWLWPELWRVVRECGAPTLFVENVPGLRKRGLGTILRGLADAGWSAEWGHYSAADVGAPHIRRRLFLLAYADRDGLSRIGLKMQGGGHGGQPGHVAHGRRGSDVADPDRSRSRQPTERHQPDQAERGHADPDNAGASVGWPPGRDPELWTGLPADAQPGVCRGSHGPAASMVDRVDRLRALGNGVVPMVAALAWRDLTSRALGG